MTLYTDLNPFNHGTAGVGYEEMLDGESSRLVTVLEEGWQIAGANILCLSAETEKNSNNFRVEIGDKTYLLKHSHINTPEAQAIINRSVAYLKDNGVKTPLILPTVDGTTFYVTKSGIFCV